MIETAVAYRLNVRPLRVSLVHGGLVVVISTTYLIHCNSDRVT